MRYISGAVEYSTNKWQCTSCNTKFEFGNNAWNIDDHCPCCGNDDPNYILSPISDYETPEQYEKRTGKNWPEQGAVWFKLAFGKTFLDGGGWGVCRYVIAKKDAVGKIIICVQSPEPPPDDWLPTEGE